MALNIAVQPELVGTTRQINGPPTFSLQRQLNEKYFSPMWKGIRELYPGDNYPGSPFAINIRGV